MRKRTDSRRSNKWLRFFIAAIMTIVIVTMTAFAANDPLTVVNNIEDKPRTKNRSSTRTLPMIPALSDKLLAMQAERDEWRRLCGRSYKSDYLDFVCVDEMGDRLRPDFITQSFNYVLAKHNLRKIRFHDLRHSCASLLLANGVSMKQIQEWLGHSTFKTTADIYAHLEVESKLSSATALSMGTAFAQAEKAPFQAENDVGTRCGVAG